MNAFESELRAHDAAVRARNLTIWMGAEPTFTLRESFDPWWLAAAEGGNKEPLAKHFLTTLAPSLARRVEVMHVVGRRFPEEPEARFAYGALWSRDDEGSVPDGAPDGVHGTLDEPPREAPTIDTSRAWLTVTPDPGVIEVNTAPAPDAVRFWKDLCAIYAAAAKVGLSTWRAFYNGQVNDSGGGGQITLGGASFAESVFFTHPWTLPGLVRYVNHHPSLSYFFATACVGSASQGPRPDEGDPTRFEELCLALDLLDAEFARETTVSPERLWASLAPLLVDGSGNSHRAELNVEKLANPHLPGRGALGVVEFRALRMAKTPEAMAAIGALLRAVTARVASERYAEPMKLWGPELHDRFALPGELMADLRSVLDDLAAHDLGLGELIVAELTALPPAWARAETPGATLTVRSALEFWALLGDVASQERAGARWVDASAARLELTVHITDGEGPGALTVQGVSVPLVAMHADDAGARWVAAVRYRGFVPSPGLHPTLAANDPLEIVWSRGHEARAISLHAWIPGGGVYDGLPSDLDDADARRSARAVVTTIAPPEDLGRLGRRTGRFTIDLRYPT